MSAFLITFRETLEAAIIVGLIFSMLNLFNTGKDKKWYIVFGVLIGIVSSIIFAFVLEFIFGSFEGTIEKIFEGGLMLLATAMITHFVLWTNLHFKDIGKTIKSGVENALSSGELWVLTTLTFVSVIREGVETVIFLKSAEFADTSGGIFYAIMGGFTAICIALLLFFVIKNINLTSVIKSTNILFVLLGAGLFSHAISEFEGAGIIPKIMKPLFDLNNTFLSENFGIGSFLKAGFSYDANPSLIAFSCYVGYILIVGYFIFFKNKKKSS